MRYFIHLAYDGTSYFGWQRQPQAYSVQEALEGGLSKLLNKPTSVIGCGRTDTGVHAKNYYAHFDADQDLDPEIVYKLNCVLPSSIAVFDVQPMQDEAHTRYDATERRYEYWMHFKKDPFKDRYSCYFPFHELDWGKVDELASLIPQYTEFKPLCRWSDKFPNATCQIGDSFWKTNDDGTKVYTVSANRFLRSMVRRIVGAMITIGRGKMSIDEFKEKMEAQHAFKIKLAVPPQGLYLVNIKYPYLNNE